jgi:hypothetical protein
MRVAFATCWAFPEGVEDDRQAAAELGAEFCRWDDPAVDWHAYDRVVIRSTWDYSSRLPEFLDWTRRVGPERLRNRPDLVAFNTDKRYLTRLSCATVPTVYVEPGDPVPELSGEVVVKPNVSAGARETGRFSPASHGLARELVGRIQESGRTALVQPHVPSVARDGERALVFIAGELSHVLRKQPILGPDEVAPTVEGGLEVALAMLREDLVAPASATEQERTLARAVIEEIAARFETPLYARVDVVSGENGAPMLLELEAVEPRLFLDLGTDGPRRLAAAVSAS